MRPFVPPSLQGGAGWTENSATAHRAEQSGFAKGRREGEAEGLARGLAEGLAEARADWQPRLAALQAELDRREAADSLTAALGKVMAMRHADRRSIEDATMAAMRAALTLIAPDLLRAAEGREVAARLASALAERAEDRLIVRAHPDTLARVKTAQNDLDIATANRITLTPEPDRARGSTEISWRSGGFTYDPHALLDEIVRALTPHAAPGQPPAEEQVDE